MTKYEEQLGADLIEHGLSGLNITNYSVERQSAKYFFLIFFLIF